MRPVDLAAAGDGPVRAPVLRTADELERLMSDGQPPTPPPTGTVAPRDQSGVAGQSFAGTPAVSGGVSEQVLQFWRNANGWKPCEPWLWPRDLSPWEKNRQGRMMRLESSRQHDQVGAQLVEALHAALKGLRDSAEPDAAFGVPGRGEGRMQHLVVVEIHPPSEAGS